MVLITITTIDISSGRDDADNFLDSNAHFGDDCNVFPVCISTHYSDSTSSIRVVDLACKW